MMHTRNEPVTVEVKSYERDIVRNPHSGTTYPPGANYHATTGSNYHSTTGTAHTRSRKNKKILWAVGALIALLLAAFLIYVILSFINNSLFHSNNTEVYHSTTTAWPTTTTIQVGPHVVRHP